MAQPPCSMDITSQIRLRVTLLLVVSSILFPDTCQAQIKNPWKGKPDSIQESFLYLDQMFDDTAKYTFLTFPEDIATARLHNRFGRWMRNNWGLWGSGRLKRELIDSGFVHPDDMSSTLLKAYHRSLSNEPLRLKDEARTYRAHWDTTNAESFSAGDLGIDHEHFTTIEDLATLFTVGDTVIVNLYATYTKMFQEYSSHLQGTAVVRSRSGGELSVELLSIEQKKRHEPEHKEGDLFQVSPLYCELIPPKGWRPPSH